MGATHRVGLTDYMRGEIGTARLDRTGRFTAGAFATFRLTYTAGRFGIDDTGGIQVTFRFASDMGTPQFADPKAAHYVTASASNGAILALSFDVKGHLRPWDKALRVKVVRGFLREGDTITLVFGDTSGGSPGIRLQTFAEDGFQFRTLCDPFATLNWCEVPEQPVIDIVAGPPATWHAVLPTLIAPGQDLALGLRADDAWGNPTALVDGTLRLAATGPLAGLPAEIRFAPGARSHRIAGLRATAPGEIAVTLSDAGGNLLCASNPLRVTAEVPLRHVWADLHGQSGETIGTNPLRGFAAFARDCAFLDAMCHQGNDFQITPEFWAELNAVSAEFDQPGRFVFIPGYEWSGNTALGGDRNVLFLREGEAIHRSSHALVGDLADADQDAFTVDALFDRLRGRDALVMAHVGGRYADIAGRGHDRLLQRQVEVHSDWGTFEWLAEDAFRAGYRVGIVANSDGHKGRHGASHPGASLFGAYGGLTCLMAPALTRDAVFQALRRRRHYCTTGTRLFLDARVDLAEAAALHEDDPAAGGRPVGRVRQALMGDILAGAPQEVEFALEVSAGTPIERIEIRDGLRVLETWRPYAAQDLGRRIRFLWEGAEYRGRGRQCFWDGGAELVGNRFAAMRPINRWNLDKRCDLVGDAAIAWTAVTTGGFGGFEAMLEDAAAGTLRFTTPHVGGEVALAELGLDDRIFDAGGLGRRIRLYRLPDANPHRQAKLTRRIRRDGKGDTALWAKVILEDGHVAWSSPIYLIPGDPDAAPALPP
ncbi:DUF3604 domain-containing protein [Roseomonas hellenica]|uniref:DUF3604 domain-containing protein n=1 Tax=Plastoroseomonas hellenica TaxID=2687306 RepID=A0ABS5EU01_9PROT|nr:DUF3604 domain-containing protein [Plastoroseomonas hellenica]MBR0663769.1 DUF3604 domain-containing protein [Plastoroseomonas hellenica]